VYNLVFLLHVSPTLYIVLIYRMCYVMHSLFMCLYACENIKVCFKMSKRVVISDTIDVIGQSKLGR